MTGACDECPLDANGSACADLRENIAIVREIFISDDLQAGEGRAVVDLDEGERFLFAHCADPTADGDGMADLCVLDEFNFGVFHVSQNK